MPDVPQKSPLEEIKQEQLPAVEYTDSERVYLGNLMNRLLSVRHQRDIAHDEFDGQTYLQYCESNRKGANTFIAPKQNKQDTNFASGTIRQKMFTYLAAINNLDLTPDIQAFDRQNNQIVALGQGMEDIMYEVGQRDNDEEKKLLRQYILFEQGTVFVEEDWEKKFRLKKNTQGKFDGKIGSLTWNSIIKKDYEGCTRNILLNENVFLGDIHQFEMKKQPYFFTVEVRSYPEAEAMYGTWERWSSVPKHVVVMPETLANSSMYSPRHFFDTTNKEEVEIIKYKNKWDDEYQIMINGVMMLEPGFPLSAITPNGEYNVEKQVNEVISPFFAYGKSMVSRMKNTTALLDEMLRMAILKTQKSFAPPMANNTGRVLSSKIFAPGTITTGIDSEKIKPLDPSARAVEGGEFNMIDLLVKQIDKNSVDPTFAGQQPTGTVTATQILEVQRQAKLMIGLTVFVCSLLEEKLAWLRLDDILVNWMEATGHEFNDYTGEWVNTYRSVNRGKMIPQAGIGRQIVKLADKIPPIQTQYDQEQAMSTPGNPVRITYISPEEIKQSRYMWFISVAPKEKRTDALNKVLFDEMMTKAFELFPNVNRPFFEERFAENWNENPAKMFDQPQPALVAPIQSSRVPIGSLPAAAPQPGVPQPKSIGATGSMPSIIKNSSG